MSLLEIEGLTVTYPGAARPVVDRIALGIDRGESLGLVGESGSGKTQTALAIMGLSPANAVVGGSVRFDGTELRGLRDSALRPIRARRIAMIFQDPRTALNPYVSIGKQLSRILIAHRLASAKEAKRRTLDMLVRVGLPDPERQYFAFPHQLSGGMRQRAMIGAALIADPELLVADEPTTALDVTVQAEILELIQRLRAESGTALLLITHDLGIVAGNCDRMHVMVDGRTVESGATADVFANPATAATRSLIDAAPRLCGTSAPDRPAAGAACVLEVDDLSVSFGERAGQGRLAALKPVGFSVQAGETLAIVGESGSGKTSLARALAGLVVPDSGRVRLCGTALAAALDARPIDQRRRLQMVFQDPLASLNPSLTVRRIVEEPLLVHEPALDAAEREGRTALALSQVGLDLGLAGRFPHELSGGQAQRVAIARSLIVRPRVLICDEAVAALDGTVRREILELLRAEQARSGLAIIFIAHDLGVVRSISHRVLVMYLGRLCELGGSDALFRTPRHPYTRALIDAVPTPDPATRRRPPPLAGEVGSILNPPSGCVFHPRCAHAVDRCRRDRPQPEAEDGRLVACHRTRELDLSATGVRRSGGE